MTSKAPAPEVGGLSDEELVETLVDTAIAHGRNIQRLKIDRDTQQTIVVVSDELLRRLSATLVTGRARGGRVMKLSDVDVLCIYRALEEARETRLRQDNVPGADVYAELRDRFYDELARRNGWPSTEERFIAIGTEVMRRVLAEARSKRRSSQP